MAKRSRSPRTLEESKPAPDSGDDVAAVLESEPPPPPPPAVKEPESPPEPVLRAVPPLPPAGPVITLAAFSRRYRGSPLMRAFLHCEKLAHRQTRKRTREQWKAEYEKFLKEPR